jgi:hypothetical protein
MVARHGASAFLRSASKVQLWASSASCGSHTHTCTSRLVLRFQFSIQGSSLIPLFLVASPRPRFLCSAAVSNHQTRTILLHAWSLPQDGEAFTGKQDATISQSYLREQDRELPEEVIYCWMLQSPGSLDREKKCVGVKEQLPLPHLLQDFHAKTRATSILFVHGRFLFLISA